MVPEEELWQLVLKWYAGGPEYLERAIDGFLIDLLADGEDLD